ncbi:MAG: methyltransferase domain-containing protein [Anaerolineae bacterium]
MDYKKESSRGWSTTPAGWSHAQEYAPGTKEFFEQVIEKRSTVELASLLKIIPFEQARGKKVLELGHGAGYDAYAFCKNGADYTGIDIATANPPRLKSHLGFYGFQPKVMLGDAENLMFPSETFDIVFSNGVLHHTPNIQKAFEETFRVLKPGGEFWVIVYHRDSIFYWWSTVLWRHLLYGGIRKRSIQRALSQVETMNNDAAPLVNVYSRGQLYHLLAATGFDVREIRVRKLAKSDMAMPRRIFRWLDKHVPQSWYDKVGEYFGWYVMGKARKPG